MKTSLLLLLLASSMAFGKPPEIVLEPDPGDSPDYGEQLMRKFNELLEKDEDLKKQFAVFEGPPKERAAGRYLGYSARPLLLHQYREAEFRDAGGTRDYEQTLVLYYTFGEGFHRGMEEVAGVFAVFKLEGHQTYVHKADDSFELVKHTVSVRFTGFRKSLSADKDES